MSEHVCTVCGRTFGQHEEDCGFCGDLHWPPPCCPGCACSSFERMHPKVMNDKGDEA